jgi:hypothetical protein
MMRDRLSVDRNPEDIPTGLLKLVKATLHDRDCADALIVERTTQRDAARTIYRRLLSRVQDLVTSEEPF